MRAASRWIGSLAFVSTAFLPGIATAQGPIGQSESPDRPNILFVCVDDLNDWVGVLGGNPQTHTPQIDRLAKRGTLFTNAHCPAPLCNASRSAVLTGIPSHRSGVYMNEHPFRKAVPEAVTIPQWFRKHDYAVQGAGKVFHNSIPDLESWDRYFPSMLQQRPQEKARGVKKAHEVPDLGLLNWGPIPGGDEGMADTKVVDWVVEQLAKESSEPFFLACGLFRTHWPWYVPEGYFERFSKDAALPRIAEDDLEDIPEIGRGFAAFKSYHPAIQREDLWSDAVAAYLSAIAFVDAQVGRILDALDESPHAANTIVVFWSDSGHHLGEKEHWGKYTLWEESTRVPLIFAGPGIPSDVRNSAAVSLMDIYPTLIELCRLEPRSEIAGTSLVPLLEGSATTRGRPVLTTHHYGNHALRTERWRYIRYQDGSEELYDLLDDPNEWNNLAGREDLAGVKSELGSWFPEENAEPGPVVPASQAKKELLEEKRKRRYERWKKGQGGKTEDE